MANLLQQAVDWLDGMRTTHLSRRVTYQRGSDSVEIVATLGATTLEVTDEAGITIRTRQTSFIVSADALVLAGEKTPPRVGDRILVPAGEKVLVFEVLALAGGEHFRAADPFGRTLRIHAKQVGEE